MKKSFDAIEKNRVQAPPAPSYPGERMGWFYFRTPGGDVLRCMVDSGAESGSDWEHVSVSVIERGAKEPTRVPSWNEMCFVKTRFWGDDETVVQFHPRASEYVNKHKYVLHLWKRVGQDYELPPMHFVG